MAVYVDPLRSYGWILRGRPYQNCHMFTDGDPAELHAIADRIGMRRSWYQAKASTPHYDLTPARRAAAIDAGALSIGHRQAVAIWRQLRAQRKGSTCTAA